MTLTISKETAELIDEVMARSDFSSVDNLLQYVLARKLAEDAVLEDEAFVKRVRAAPDRSQKAGTEGRTRAVTKIEHGKLYETIKRRAEERHDTNETPDT